MPLGDLRRTILHSGMECLHIRSCSVSVDMNHGAFQDELPLTESSHRLCVELCL